MVDDRDFVFKYWPEQALMEDMCSPEAYISTHNDNHQNLFATSLHHAANSRMPHHQQDRLGMPGPSYYAPGSPNAAFFQMPTPKMSTLPGPSGLPPSTSTSTTTTTAAAAPHHYRQESPTSTHSDRSHSKQRSSARSTDGDEFDDEAQAAIKRQRNTMAARKYRQKRLDRIADLERALSDMAGERDELKLKLARREAEVEALREVLGKR